jgi:hypothetical protein
MRSRFSADAVEKQIHDAISEARRLLAATPPSASPENVPLRPFVIWDQSDAEDD